MSYLFSWTPPRRRRASGPAGSSKRVGRFGPGTSANLLGFDHQKSTNTRLGPAKVPQPGVDLVNVTAR